MNKIIKLSFDEDDRNNSIADLFESIEFYRSEGKSLAAIYSALKKKKAWTQSQSSFSRQYYQHRRQYRSQHIKPDAMKGPVLSSQPSHVVIS